MGIVAEVAGYEILHQRDVHKADPVSINSVQPATAKPRNE
jgi:hypothetical protein